MTDDDWKRECCHLIYSNKRKSMKGMHLYIVCLDIRGVPNVLSIQRPIEEDTEFLMIRQANEILGVSAAFSGRLYRTTKNKEFTLIRTWTREPSS